MTVEQIFESLKKVAPSNCSPSGRTQLGSDQRHFFELDSAGIATVERLHALGLIEIAFEAEVHFVLVHEGKPFTDRFRALAANGCTLERSWEKFAAEPREYADETGARILGIARSFYARRTPCGDEFLVRYERASVADRLGGAEEWIAGWNRPTGKHSGFRSLGYDGKQDLLFALDSLLSDNRRMKCTEILRRLKSDFGISLGKNSFGPDTELGKILDKLRKRSSVHATGGLGIDGDFSQDE